MWHGGLGQAGMGDEQELAGGREDSGGIFKGTGFAEEGGRIIGVGTDLDEECAAMRIAGQEIDLIAGRGVDPGDFHLAALEFGEHGAFEQMAGHEDRG